MKKFMTLILAGMLVGTLCVAFTACNDPKGQGQTRAVKEVDNAIGTVIGSFVHGVFYVLVQVDKEYPIGGTIEYTPDDETSAYWSATRLPYSGTYQNIIRVQPFLATPEIEISNKRISFSCRAFEEGRDNELFVFGSGPSNTLGVFCPNVPIYIITDYQILND